MESQFHRKLHDLELDGVKAFFRGLQLTSIRRDEEDRLDWKETKCDKFFVKSYYYSLSQRRNEVFPSSIV